MRTTLDLPDDTFRRLKAEAALRGFKLKELVTQLIEVGLAAGVPAPAPVRRRSPPPIPIARAADGKTTPELSNAELQGILNEEDIAEYRRVMAPAKPRR